ncbi:hypothetical protein WA026_019661 [Henosepilachna vigintioctopunctata]|uniref:Uncharacterized protein n=1 Tax=Henosepilachna vigintioctopunctata TaxID=420089 RepID=A0AAW1UNQ5_9CUCU
MLNLILVSPIMLLLIDQSLGSALHGPCASHEECGTFDTHCRNGTCVCKDNFMTVFDSCVHVATENIECKRKEECHSILGSKSTCKNKRCVCRPFHHLHKKQCVKNKDLHDFCEHDHQCYCGQDCIDRIGCIKHKCTCKEGYKPYSIRRCIVDPYHPVESPPIEVVQRPLTSPATSGAAKFELIFLYIFTIFILLNK